MLAINKLLSPAKSVYSVRVRRLYSPMYWIVLLLMPMESLMALPVTPGIHDIKLDTSVGEVYVSLAVPEVAQFENLPLVLVLHYAGQPTPYYGRPLLEYLMLPAFEQTKAIFVAPTSVGGDWKQANNLTMVFELIDMLEEQFQTDKARRIVAGYSMGAIGTWHLACEKPGYFSAAIPIAGFPQRLPECATPIYTVVSDSDEVFSFQNFEQNLQAPHDIKLRYGVVNGAGHYDISAFTTVLKDAVKWLNDMWH